MSKQDDLNDLMDLIHRYYTPEEIEKYKAYSNMGVEEAPKVVVNVNTNSNGH